MAKPINPYQGPAPAIMARMPEIVKNYTDAAANAENTLQAGKASMMQGLMGGVSTVASAYGDYKKMQSGVKASENAYETFRSSLSPEVQQSIDARIEGMNKDTGVSLQDKAAFWNEAKGMMGGAINQKYSMDKQAAELNAAAARQGAQITSQEGQPFRNAVAGYMFPEDRQPSNAAGAGIFGSMQIPQQTPSYSTQPQNPFAVPRKFSYHTQFPEVR